MAAAFYGGREARRIRVAQIITGLVLGGGGQVMFTIARNIDKSRFDVDVFCVIEGGEFLSEIEALGTRVKVLKAFDPTRVPKYRVTKIMELASQLKTGKYDIVHTHLFKADTIGRLAAALAGTPHVLKTVHNMGTRKTRRQCIVDRVLNCWTDKVICVSESQRESVIRDERLPASRVVTINNGVRLADFRRNYECSGLASELRLDDRRVTIGTIGRLIKEKGQIFLLRAIPLILEAHPNSQFLIVGDGELRSYFEEHLRDKPYRDLVRITGLRKDVPDLLSLMDVFVFPSLSEAFGIAAVEAMAAGCPVVCSSIPALREIVIDGETGLYCDPENPASLAKAVIFLLDHPLHRLRIIENAYKEVAKKYSDERMVRALGSIYLEVLGS